MKRVLQISNYYTPHVGGIEKTCQYLSEGLSNEYEVRVVCFSEDKLNKEETLNNIRIFKAGVILNIARQALSISYIKILRKQIKEWDPDVIHLHYPNPFVAALLLPLIPKHTKLYIHWHLDIMQNKIYPLIKPIERMILRRANFIAATSPNYRDFSKPLKPFLSKTGILPSAIDLTEYQLKMEDEKMIKEIKNKSNGKKIIFYLGRHVFYKGLEILIDAEPLIKSDCIIFIGGSGPITQKVKKKCLSQRVHFLGRLSEQEIRCYYHSADIFTFPSYTKSESFGLTLVEAMFCNAVPVTFTIPGSGVNWVSINKETGLEVPNLNKKEYAHAIDKLLKNNDMRAQLSANGRQRVIDNFSIEKEINTLKEQYKMLLKQ